MIAVKNIFHLLAFYMMPYQRRVVLYYSKLAQHIFVITFRFLESLTCSYRAYYNVCDAPQSNLRTYYIRHYMNLLYYYYYYYYYYKMGQEVTKKLILDEVQILNCRNDLGNSSTLTPGPEIQLNHR